MTMITAVLSPDFLDLDSDIDMGLVGGTIQMIQTENWNQF